MRNKKLTIISWALMITFLCGYWVWADLQYHTEALLNSLILALDPNHNGDPTDDTWYTTFDGKISSLAEDSTPDQGGNLNRNGYLAYEANATSFTDSDAPSPDLSSAHQIITFTDDGGADVDTITGFSNIVTGCVYEAEFVDAYWIVDFSGTNLKGHAGNDWSPRAGDSMSFYTTDGTTIVCNISSPTSLSITQYYEMPISTIANLSDHGASGFVKTVTIDSGVTSTYSTCLIIAVDGEYELADKDATTTLPCVALAIEDGQGSKKVLTYGRWRDDTANWTIGPGVAGSIYVGDDGALTQTQVSTTGDFSQRVGYAESADVMFFCPDMTITEVPE